MSRLGRSVGYIAILVDEPLNNGVKLIFIKENMEQNGRRNIQSKLDGKEKEIRRYLAKGLNKANVARIYGVNVGTLNSFINSRELQP